MKKQEIFDRVDENENLLKKISQQIWENPELGLHEEKSSATLIETLEKENFNVETNIGEMPTAFVATYGKGHPKIGILGEYDALPSLSQKVTAERDPIEKDAPGHGCGHNLFGTAGVGAVIAIKEGLEADELEGTIVFYGCPAEETLVGKTYMARAGVFDDLDAALSWHPGDLSTPWLKSTNALDSIQFNFEGVSAHAAGSPESGRSALDAVELLNTGVEYMREHITDDARMHYTITNGGQAPNVVPANASVWYFVRAPTRTEVEQNSNWLRDIADAAAQMTQTKVEERIITGCYDYRANHTVTDTIWENMQNLGPIKYDEDDYEFARELWESVPEEDRKANISNIPKQLRKEIENKALYPEPVKAFDEEIQMSGSTDVGDVSWITPTGQFNAATWPVGTPGHSWQIVAANGDFGQKGVPYAAKILAGTAYDLMIDPEILEEAQEEFNTMLNGQSYETPLSDNAKPPFDMTVMND